ncbi:hypothetical protein GW17_00031925 [Ensete ventricosum]|nr:hypothetical protein GW17_00031925 [Ensete ventricosum]
MRMALRLAFLSFLLGMAIVAAGATYAGDEWGVARLASEGGGLTACDGRVGECVGDEEEMAMESVSARRSLASRTKFISYGALTKDRVPCNRRGQSYYNCQRQKKVNPYRRGCSAITKCARILH